MSSPLIFNQEIIEMLTNIFKIKDAYTEGHSKRVAMYSLKIAQAMGLDEEEQNTIYQAGLLHDIGKILTPEAILLKPRKFKRSEYAIMKNHSIDGENMISHIPSFKKYAEIIRHHHERYDGRGYPDGLSGDKIPLLSRIMSVADAFDAMTTNRIYKAHKNLSEAIFEIDRCSGTQFDPEIAKYAIVVFCTSLQCEDMGDSYVQVIQEERFAYFYKDTLTCAYTGEYLNYFLHQNKQNRKFESCSLIQIQNMHQYNERFGWKSGDKVLVEIALRLKVLFKTAFVFRIFGDDFVVLNSLHVKIDEDKILRTLINGFNGIGLHIKHIDFKLSTIEKWENFENYLISSPKKGV